MIRGREANQAVEESIGWIKSQRSGHPNNLDRIVFVFPRVKLQRVEGWQDGTALMMAAAAIARNPDKRRCHVPEPKYYGPEHGIPSYFVWLSGIEDLEYHVSKKNLQRLLEVGCAVFQRSGSRKVGVRIPLKNPLFHGAPFQFETEQ